jgi:methylmalonyl-CoA mutase, N-terminal domain
LGGDNAGAVWGEESAVVDAAVSYADNIVRTALQALAAVLGGTQSLHTNGYDEALALPTEEAARIALRTQQIIACESGVANTIDPVAGSYCIEALTTGIEEQVARYFERIEAMGGMIPAIERGWVQAEIQNAAYATQCAIDAGEATVVGVNRFTRETEPPIPTQHMDEALERRQVERLRALRAKRDAGRWGGSLDGVRETARSGENLMPAILEATESYATVGEIASTLREVFGEYQESVSV